jgi:glucosamine-6-phosphate deaminase
MQVRIYTTEREACRAAAAHTGDIVRDAVHARGRACLIAAAGRAHMALLDVLLDDTSIDWARTIMFYIDEYVGLPPDHPENFLRHVSERPMWRLRPGTIHVINGCALDPQQACARLNGLVQHEWVDVALVDMGAEGHLAFNAPPADLDTDRPFMVVDLDSSTSGRMPGFPGRFKRVSDIPVKAITSSLRQLMRSHHIVCTAFGEHTAAAVRDSLEQDILPLQPASILKKHPRATVFLDAASALELKGEGTSALHGDGN